VGTNATNTMRRLAAQMVGKHIRGGNGGQLDRSNNVTSLLKF
jgi:hypothetical protein